VAERPGFLSADVDVLFFGGKGGVGKTTLASATALERSRTERIRLLSTDPAHSVSDSLAGSDADRDPGRSLIVEELDADAELAAFRSAHRETLHEIIDRGTLFESSSIQQLLDLALPGMDAVMAFLRLADLATPQEEPDRPGDLLVVDTAPTGHTLRLLDTPAQFERWVGFLDVLLEKHRTMRNVFAGATGPDALDTFVTSMREKTKRVRTLLQDPERCRFVVVTQAEPIVWTETDRLLNQLQDRSIPVSEVVINRWRGGSPTAAAVHPDISGTLERLDASGWVLPEQDRELRGPDALGRVWTHVYPLSRSRASHAAPNRPSPEERDGPGVRISLPEPCEEFLLVAGKGGVGKTTMASALALARAETASGDHPVLLASTDPAHSLSAALGTELTDAPRPVAPGLEAVEIDAPGRFEQLRETYASEVRQFFDETGGPTVDPTHDRRVTEALMDLAPPGIDEVMGWTAVMEFLRDNRYDTCVLDTAPTGHFLQLLAMPAIFQGWIRTFFRILRNHRHVVRLPDLVDRLVRLSKQVKTVRSMLRDGSAGILGVTIPTRMALAELNDLDRSAGKQETRIGAVVLNRLADGTASPERRSAHASILAAYRAAFPDRPLGVVTEGRPPRNLSDLRALGTELFEARR